MNKELEDRINRVRQAIADVMDCTNTVNMTAGDTIGVFDAAKTLTAAIEEFHGNARERVLSIAPPEGGTFVDHESGYSVEVRRTKTGLDPKRVEAFLRTKKWDPGTFMAPKVTYALTEHTEKLLRTLQDVNEAELAGLRYAEPTWVVMTPKKITNEETVNE